MSPFGAQKETQNRPLSPPGKSKMLKQISIFAENKRGQMRRITQVLLEHEVNILGSVTNDSAEYGMIRMVVSDPEEALQALTDSGYICRLTDVIGVEVNDEVGNLNKLLTTLYNSNINVNYIYLSFNRHSGKPIMVLHTDDCYEVEECLMGNGYDVV